MIFEYEAAIGIEVHVELKTKTKAFCSCSAKYGGAPNTNCCPICLGMPGTLPVLNKRAFELAVIACLSVGCEISPCSHFDRKNYFYPDLPKGYQITQNETPLGKGGYVDIFCGGFEKRIGISRIHFEEDAGKLIHKPDSGVTYIDYNRCGVPLIEIVSEPDMKNAAEAKAYLTELKRILLFAGVSDCRMNEGSMRCDLNVSVKRKGEHALGTRCEIKNINSINYAGRAIDAEIERQSNLIDSGGYVKTETRRYNEDTGKTERMRDKESAAEYRFIREPDLPAVLINEHDIERLTKELGRSPACRIDMYIKKWSISRSDAELICTCPEYADYYEDAANKTDYPQIAANLFIGGILPGLSDSTPEIPPEWLAETADLFGSGKLSSSNAKRLIYLQLSEKKPPRELMAKYGLEKITDEAAIKSMIEDAVIKRPSAVQDIVRGKNQAKKVIIGEVMKISNGKADPVIVVKEVDLYFEKYGR